MPELAPLLSVPQLPQSVAGVLLERREMRRHFTKWCEYRMSKVNRTLAAHHRLITNTIEKLLRGELGSRQLMILMPPGSAKSTYTSVLLPSWFLNPEQHPEELMLACSYSYTLIEGFGKQARDIVNEDHKVLGISISKTSAAAGDWRTNRKGGYFCAGVNAGIAGHRATLGLIDDYLGSEEEANSKVIRDKNWNWYWNDFFPRLLPEAFEIIIANRRHEDDMVGRHLNETHNKWHVVRIPMLAEDNDPLGRQVGERLWSGWFTQDQVDAVRKRLRTWASLYQQRPAPEEGNYFKRDDILTYKIHELPNDLRIYAGSDWALRRGQDNDYTCHLLGGVDKNGRLWILPEWFWGRVDTLEATNKMFEMSKRHKPICWWHGRENITGSIGPFIYKRMAEENNYIPIEELPEGRDKEAKAQSIKARISARMVMFPDFVPDWERAITEMLNFPAGTHDDFVDALSKLGQGLSHMTAASIRPVTWDGIVKPQRITCGWVQRSHKARERANQYANIDN